MCPAECHLRQASKSCEEVAQYDKGELTKLGWHWPPGQVSPCLWWKGGQRLATCTVVLGGRALFFQSLLGVVGGRLPMATSCAPGLTWLM